MHECLKIWFTEMQMNGFHYLLINGNPFIISSCLSSCFYFPCQGPLRTEAECDGKVDFYLSIKNLQNSNESKWAIIIKLSSEQGQGQVKQEYHKQGGEGGVTLFYKLVSPEITPWVQRPNHCRKAVGWSLESSRLVAGISRFQFLAFCLLAVWLHTRLFPPKDLISTLNERENWNRDESRSS